MGVVPGDAAHQAGADRAAALPGATAEDAVKFDWGGQTYGGLYTEVINGIHVNDITVKGFFVIRQALTGEELIAQDYDK